MSSLFIPVEGLTPVFAGSKLVLPGVGVGNVGQMAIDVMLSTAVLQKFEEPAIRKVGHLYTVHVPAVVGNDAVGAPNSGQLAVTLEVWQTRSGRITFLQQRAAHLPGHGAAYVAELVGWIQEAKFATVYVASGCDAAQRVEAQLSGPQSRFVHTPNASVDHAVCTSAGVMPFELPAVVSRLPTASVLLAEPLITEGAVETKDDTDPTERVLHAVKLAGQSVRLFKAAQAASIPLVLVLRFVAEGNNLPDGIAMGQALEPIIGFFADISASEAAGRWILPPSMRHLMVL